MSRSWTGETRRLFVAADLPHQAAMAIAEWQQRELAEREDVRVAASLHLTLCFLGDVAVARVPTLVAALERVRFGRIELEAGEVIFLPERGARRVIALELVDEAGALAALQRDVAATLAGLGLYKPEKRPFLPHVTVARFRRQGHPFSLQNVNVPRFCVDQVVLYSSLLERGGAVHTPLHVFHAS